MVDKVTKSPISNDAGDIAEASAVWKVRVTPVVSRVFDVKCRLTAVAYAATGGHERRAASLTSR